MVPGEGMLGGSFARALFLVHSECAASAYINSRPFRVNAGPVSLAPPQRYSWEESGDVHAKLTLLCAEYG